MTIRELERKVEKYKSFSTNYPLADYPLEKLIENGDKISSWQCLFDDLVFWERGTTDLKFSLAFVCVVYFIARGREIDLISIQTIKEKLGLPYPDNNYNMLERGLEKYFCKKPICINNTNLYITTLGVESGFYFIRCASVLASCLKIIGGWRKFLDWPDADQSVWKFFNIQIPSRLLGPEEERAKALEQVIEFFKELARIYVERNMMFTVDDICNIKKGLSPRIAQKIVLKLEAQKTANNYVDVTMPYIGVNEQNRGVLLLPETGCFPDVSDKVNPVIFKFVMSEKNIFVYYNYQNGQWRIQANLSILITDCQDVQFNEHSVLPLCLDLPILIFDLTQQKVISRGSSILIGNKYLALKTKCHFDSDHVRIINGNGGYTALEFNRPLLANAAMESFDVYCGEDLRFTYPVDRPQAVGVFAYENIYCYSADKRRNRYFTDKSPLAIDKMLELDNPSVALRIGKSTYQMVWQDGKWIRPEKIDWQTGVLTIQHGPFGARNTETINNVGFIPTTFNSVYLGEPQELGKLVEIPIDGEIIVFQRGESTCAATFKRNNTAFTFKFCLKRKGIAIRYFGKFRPLLDNQAVNQIALQDFEKSEICVYGQYNSRTGFRYGQIMKLYPYQIGESGVSEIRFAAINKLFGCVGIDSNMEIVNFKDNETILTRSLVHITNPEVARVTIERSDNGDSLVLNHPIAYYHKTKLKRGLALIPVEKQDADIIFEFPSNIEIIENRDDNLLEKMTFKNFYKASQLEKSNGYIGFLVYENGSYPDGQPRWQRYSQGFFVNSLTGAGVLTDALGQALTSKKLDEISAFFCSDDEQNKKRIIEFIPKAYNNAHLLNAMHFMNCFHNAIMDEDRRYVCTSGYVFRAAWYWMPAFINNSNSGLNDKRNILNNFWSPELFGYKEGFNTLPKNSEFQPEYKRTSWWYIRKYFNENEPDCGASTLKTLLKLDVTNVTCEDLIWQEIERDFPDIGRGEDLYYNQQKQVLVKHLSHYMRSADRDIPDPRVIGCPRLTISYTMLRKACLRISHPIHEWRKNPCLTELASDKRGAYHHSEQFFRKVLLDLAVVPSVLKLISLCLTYQVLQDAEIREQVKCYLRGVTQ